MKFREACIRCPVLSINPRMLPRLDELEEDLLARRQGAVDENWRGEIEGIDLTRTFLRSKRAQGRRTTRLGTPGQTDLGMPASRPADHTVKRPTGLVRITSAAITPPPTGSAKKPPTGTDGCDKFSFVQAG
ncbi:hypothetical protein AB0H88_16180 [Nonomuraea sp. NPDC050680]|uniref:hypothetical protein n=1 Tax=Nonomuraea sp. NPDC050680 TaxID=3154630 RepID=UPI0033F97465